MLPIPTWLINWNYLLAVNLYVLLTVFFLFIKNCIFDAWFWQNLIYFDLFVQSIWFLCNLWQFFPQSNHKKWIKDYINKILSFQNVYIYTDYSILLVLSKIPIKCYPNHHGWWSQKIRNEIKSTSYLRTPQRQEPMFLSTCPARTQ